MSDIEAGSQESSQKPERFYDQKLFAFATMLGGMAIAASEMAVPEFQGAEYVRGSLFVGGLYIAIAGYMKGVNKDLPNRDED